MKIYNTLTKQVEVFESNEPGLVKMYTCGPTVYNYAHIGNIRAYIFEDVLEKTLEYIGFKVMRVMNITDVGHMTSDADEGEDKMLKGAKREHKTVYEISEFYTNAFFSDIKKLNIRKPRIVEKASDHIREYIKIIKKLEEDGYAYVSNGNVYFDVDKFSDYYKLSGKNKEDLLVGVREDVENDEYKHNPYDFGLWFTKSKFEDQAMKWDSPWGVGYPGWHIECSGIALKYLGEHLDIHCGGVDNIFPHHTNEIAQSECYLGHKWCNYWVHGGFLNDKNGKMSKSSGEFLTVSLLEEKGYNPLVYRFMCLQSHYRNNLMFSYEALNQNKIAYEKLLNKIKNIKYKDEMLDEDLVNEYLNKFSMSLENDLNTANVITYLFDIIKDERLNSASKLHLIKEYDKVLSLDLLKEEKKNKLTKEMKDLIDERSRCKREKNYDRADEIREELLSMGIELKDTRDGVEIIWI